MDKWKLLAHLIVHDKGHWGLQNYKRDDDGQTDVELRIPDIEIPEEELYEWQKIIGGQTRRTDKHHPASEYHGSLQLVISNEEFDEALNILYNYMRITPHRQSTRVHQALKIRERVKQGCSYPWWDHRSKVKA